MLCIALTSLEDRAIVVDDRCYFLIVGFPVCGRSASASGNPWFFVHVKLVQVCCVETRHQGIACGVELLLLLLLLLFVVAHQAQTHKLTNIGSLPHSSAAVCLSQIVLRWIWR